MTHETDVRARIADALRGVTPGEWRYDTLQECVYEVLSGSVICDFSRWSQRDRDGHLFAAAPSLLRDADARIAALEAERVALDQQCLTCSLTANHFLDDQLYKHEQSRRATWQSDPSLDELFDCLIDAARLFGIARAFSVVGAGSDAKTLNEIADGAAEHVTKAILALEKRLKGAPSDERR